MINPVTDKAFAALLKAGQSDSHGFWWRKSFAAKDFRQTTQPSMTDHIKLTLYSTKAGVEQKQSCFSATLKWPQSSGEDFFCECTIDGQKPQKFFGGTPVMALTTAVSFLLEEARFSNAKYDELGNEFSLHKYLPFLDEFARAPL